MDALPGSNLRYEAALCAKHISLPPVEHSGQGCPENRQPGWLPYMCARNAKHILGFHRMEERAFDGERRWVGESGDFSDSVTALQDAIIARDRGLTSRIRCATL